MKTLFLNLFLAICITAFTPYTNFSGPANAMSVNFSPNGLLLAGCYDNNKQYIYSFSTL
jgi:hypothetical protein